LDSDSALLTRRKDGSLVLALWNYAPPEQPGAPKTVVLHFKNAKLKRAVISRVDAEHGDVHALYEKLGAPRYPTHVQIEQLKMAADLPAPESRALKNGELTLTLPSYGLALVEVK
jgi:xylan 1,4-beta-xylosidase